jgi:hypothetical protein
MDIFIKSLDNIMFMLMILSLLNIIRNVFLFIRHLNKPEPESYKIKQNELLYLGIAISIFITYLFKGV